MNFICKDNFGRDVFREEVNIKQYCYHVQISNIDVLTLVFPKTTGIATVLNSINGMRTGLGTPEQARVLLKARVNEMRAEKLVAPLMFNGVLYDGDEAAQMNVIGTLLPFIGGVPVPNGFSWRAADNTDHPFTLPTLVAFSAAFLARGYACHMNSRVLKAALDNASDPESVDINAGWPD
jgi:hypothetical protein